MQAVTEVMTLGLNCKINAKHVTSAVKACDSVTILSCSVTNSMASNVQYCYLYRSSLMCNSVGIIQQCNDNTVFVVRFYLSIMAFLLLFR